MMTTRYVIVGGDLNAWIRGKGGRIDNIEDDGKGKCKDKCENKKGSYCWS